MAWWCFAASSLPSGRGRVADRDLKPSNEVHHAPELEVGGRRSSALRVIQPLELDASFELVTTPGSVPKTRAECEKGPRPCPYVLCKEHIWFVEPDARPGRRHLVEQGGAPTATINPATMTTCALDVAATGPKTFGEIGDLFGVTDERARIIHEEAMAKIEALGYSIDELFPEAR